jgi:Putative auto-transporter adhesin, head GIN domain
MRSFIPLLVFGLSVVAPASAAEIVPVASFSSVQLRGGGEVSLRYGPVQRVTLIEGSRQFTQVRVDSHRKMTIDACNSRCPRHYRLRIVIESPTVPVLAVQGGGTITAAPGFSDQSVLTLAVGGGGAIDARAVPVETATAAVSGGGDIKVRPRRVLTAAVNGGGTIRYWGDPAVTTVINGGGTVRPGG